MSEFLPEELAVEILARLSMKDLARFKCVCKTWRDLINHRDFAKRYKDISPVKFVSFDDKGFYLLDVEGKNTPVNKLAFPLDHKSMIDESTCVLHCNGTLCVTLKNHTLMVWNPFSKHFKIVPNPGTYRDSSILGFGYDPVNDEFKVVTFVDRLGSSTAHVCEFRTGSWSESVRIPNPDWHYRERRGTFLDQCLYWIAYRSHIDRFIFCFDISNHEYRKIPLPVCNQSVSWSWLAVTNQKLCITEYESCKKEIYVSVMEKTGTWSKLVSISLSNFISAQDRMSDYELDFVSFTKKNDLVVTFTKYYDNSKTGSEGRTTTKVFLYKTGEETFEQVRLCNFLPGLRFLCEYVETSVFSNQIFV